MADLPEHFQACKIEVVVESYGMVGTVVGLLFQYPCWVGILEPVSDITVWLEDIRNRLDDSDLGIQLQDLASGEFWIGSLSRFDLPRSDYLWYELTWHDDRKPPK